MSKIELIMHSSDSLEIARYEGWEIEERYRQHKGRRDSWTTVCVRHSKHTSGIWRTSARLFDYFRDLEAIQDAVLALPKHQQEVYVDKLDSIVCRDGDGGDFNRDFDNINARPAQRAEAFLETIRNKKAM